MNRLADWAAATFLVAMSMTAAGLAGYLIGHYDAWNKAWIERGRYEEKAP